MRKSIFLLLILLISCSPVSTSTPTSTPFPSTATATPPPTETPTATPTPEGFQTSPDGAVQVYENGNWVNLSSKIPDTIWGDRPEGASVVLKDGEALLRMELSNFQSPDGSAFADIAEYDPETKKWEVKPFTMLRSIPLTDTDLYVRNHQLISTPDAEARVNLFWNASPILGVKVLENETGELGYELMIAYKGQVRIVSPEETFISIFNISKGARDEKLFDTPGLEVPEVLDLVRHINNYYSSVDEDGYATPIPNFFVLQRGATEESCSKPSPNLFGEKFINWCKEQLQMGSSAKHPNKDNIDWIILNGYEDVPTDNINQDIEQDLLNALWDKDIRVEIEGVYQRLVLTWR